MNIIKKIYLIGKARLFGLSFDERVMLYQRYLKFESRNAYKILRIHFQHHHLVADDYEYFNYNNHRLWSLFLKNVSYKMLNHKAVQEQIIYHAPDLAFTFLDEKLDERGECELLLSRSEAKINFYVRTFQLTSGAENKLIDLYKTTPSEFWEGVVKDFIKHSKRSLSFQSVSSLIKINDRLAKEIILSYSMFKIPNEKIIEFLLNCEKYEFLRIILANSYIKSSKLQKRIEDKHDLYLDVALQLSILRKKWLDTAIRKNEHYGITKMTWEEYSFIREKNFENLDNFLQNPNLTLSFLSWVLYNFPEQQRINVHQKLINKQYNTKKLRR